MSEKRFKEILFEETYATGKVMEKLSPNMIIGSYSQGRYDGYLFLIDLLDLEHEYELYRHCKEIEEVI